MGLQDDLKSETTQTFATRWNRRDGRQVPEAEQVQLGNYGVELDATILYADIDGSTAMVDSLPAEQAAEIYKTYLRCAARIIQSEGGTITAYDGDRVMAVYIGDHKNTSAARSALKLAWAVANIINPAYKSQYPTSNFILRQVVGIDTSKLLIARTGVRGANDLVWVGSAANHAAKLSAISQQPYSTFVSDAVYGRLADETKYTNGRSMWEWQSWNGKIIYRSNWTWRID